MTTTRFAPRILAIAATGALVLALAGCGGDDAPADPGGSDTATDTSSPEPEDTATDDAATDTDSPAGATFPGDGEYAIGTDIPYGGFQLLGEPAEQPAGCTWEIQDDTGAAIFENQGPYVFLTDIPEAVTFVTVGCPEWEQFE